MMVEEHVQSRYSEGAKEKQAALCCPVQYQQELLTLLPQEIIEKDYGCGDPSRYVREGDVVLDLGSGGGKVCYMAAQLVGEKGHVHGVDMTDDMLALARKYQTDMAQKIGQDRVTFYKGYIQDLALDLDAASRFVGDNPIADHVSLLRYESWKKIQRRDQPMIASGSVSLVISNCVLNLVDKNDRRQLLGEVYRVLAPGGRVAISDIVSDQPVPEAMQQDEALWSGCISGAFEQQEFLQAFVDNGFVNVAYDGWSSEPWQVVEGIEFRSATLVASKPHSSVDFAQHQVMYLGPFASVSDDNGKVFPRGQRVAVDGGTYADIMASSVAAQFVDLAVQVSSTGKPKLSTRSCC